jgi:hypothetical protein
MASGRNLKSFTFLMSAVAPWAISTLLFAENSIGLSPASISLKGTPGQMATQSFKIVNGTDTSYKFRVQVADVLVEDGKRKFLPAGQSRGSIAALVTAPPGEINLSPGQNSSVPVTFVLPENTDIRAVAVFFIGEQATAKPETQFRARISLGTVVDFTASEAILLQAVPPQITPQTSTTNMLTTQDLVNAGREPFIAKAVAAFLDKSGKLMGKVTFEQKRLLPGERNALHAEYPGTLPPGKYRALCSIEYGGKLLTTTADFLLP